MTLMIYKYSQNITYGPKVIKTNYHDQGLIPLIDIGKRVRKINCFGRKYKRMPIYLPGIYSNRKDTVKGTNKMSYVVQ